MAHPTIATEPSIKFAHKGDVLLLSQGCAANTAESEMMAGLLHQAGWRTSGEHSNPNAVALNLCTVKGNASALQAVQEITRRFPQKPLVVTGCITLDLVRQLRKTSPQASILTTRALHRIAFAVEQSVGGNRMEDLSRHHNSPGLIPRKRQNPLIGILPVQSGCLDACTFCSTRLVKGKLRSLAPEQILQDAQQALSEQCRELWITGQDAGCYGMDLGTNLAKLLEMLLIKLPGNYQIRVGMGNPRHVLNYAPQLAELFWDPRMYQFLHLPVQSGSDRILSAMGRQHGTLEFRQLVQLFRQQNARFTIGTDIIVGFPGESETDFNQTMDLLRETRPSIIHRTRFVPRAGTAAAQLSTRDKSGNISLQIKRERLHKLNELYEEIAKQENKRWHGWEGQVDVLEPGKDNTWIARTTGYRPIVLRQNLQLGDRVFVRINGNTQWHLEAEILQEFS